MTDPAPVPPAPLAFVQPTEFETSMQMAREVAGLLRADRGVMPDKVADALTAFGGAGQDTGVQEDQIEALYDWACLGADCPDDARRVAYGCASLFSRYSFGIMGKAVSADRPKRSDGIRAEMLRQMGDPSAVVTEADRPEPKGQYVTPPPKPYVSATVEDIAALVGKISTVREGLQGSMTKAHAASMLDEVQAAAEAMTSDPPADQAAA